MRDLRICLPPGTLENGKRLKIMWNTAGYRYITDDELVTVGHGLLYGVFFDTSVDGDTISVYDGLDADSGRLIFHSSGWAVDPNVIPMPAPVHYENGLYVVLSTNVTDATIFFSPIRGETIENTQLLETLRSLLIQPEA